MLRGEFVFRRVGCHEGEFVLPMSGSYQDNFRAGSVRQHLLKLPFEPPLEFRVPAARLHGHDLGDQALLQLPALLLPCRAIICATLRNALEQIDVVFGKGSVFLSTREPHHSQGRPVRRRVQNGKRDLSTTRSPR